MNIFRWLGGKIHASQRAIDLDILWPVCKKEAGDDLALARMAFGVHCYGDPAWLCLGEAEIRRRLEALQ